MTLAAVSLDDKYVLESGRVYLTGTQALVRLALMQRRRDQQAGLNTAAFISGYRGSPLGGFDQALWRARKFLAESHIHFQPGVNEDLGATAVWGSQQVGLWPGAKYDGVYAIWYGKGPGVDRSGDVFKHGNFAGSSPHGGVLALAGDDHACKSSTVPHQSEHAFAAAMMPVLNPSNVQEILDLGLYGWAMSRYSGCWVGFKTIAETVDSSASVHVDPQRINIALPDDFEMPEGGLNIRWPDPPMIQEHRLMQDKIYAALAFCRANKLDRVIFEAPKRRFGVVTVGKSYLDVRQALQELGIDAALAREIGLAIYKVAMPWPLEPDGVRAFAEGLDELIVVEEKRALIENQLKEQLYNWQADKRPVVVGKFDEERDWILPSTGELSPAQIAVVIGRRLLKRMEHTGIAERVAFLEEKERQKVTMLPAMQRIPYFCSGCPHNTSTRVPDGSRALAGIGCHYMATWMDRSTETFSQMGGEGVAWVGQAPFTETEHVFANLGDGTYFHSGLLAIRAAVASGVNITYKILYNDAVAMTGGQPMDGPLDVPMIARQVAAEGARKIVVVSDEPEKYGGENGLPPDTDVEHRDDLDQVQRQLREVPGTTILIYDQTCAAEKRRRRKRGKMVDPRQAGDHQRVGLRRLRRLLGAVQLPERDAGRDRIRPQARHRPVELQQGFLLREGILPQLRDRRGRRIAQAGEAGRRRQRSRRCPLRHAAGARASRAGRPIRDPGDRHRRHRRRHHRCAGRYGGASGGQGLFRARSGRPCAEGRCGGQPSAHRQDAGRHQRRAHRRRRRRPGAGLRPRGCRRHRDPCRKCARASPAR